MLKKEKYNAQLMWLEREVSATATSAEVSAEREKLRLFHRADLSLAYFESWGNNLNFYFKSSPWNKEET